MLPADGAVPESHPLTKLFRISLELARLDRVVDAASHGEDLGDEIHHPQDVREVEVELRHDAGTI